MTKPLDFLSIVTLVNKTLNEDESSLSTENMPYYSSTLTKTLYLSSVDSEAKMEFYPKINLSNGNCLVFNYRNFTSQLTRAGTEFDEASLKRVFKEKFGFKWNVISDKNKLETRKALKICK